MKKFTYRFSFEDLLNMTEEQLDELLESGQIDDDDWQYWHDMQDDAEILGQRFVEDELKYWI